MNNRNWPYSKKHGRDVDELKIVDEGVRDGHYYCVVGARVDKEWDHIRIDFMSRHKNQHDFDAAIRAATFFEDEHEDTGFSKGGL